MAGRRMLRRSRHRASCCFVLPNAPRPWEAAPGMTFGWTWFDGWPPDAASVAASRELLLRAAERAAAVGGGAGDDVRLDVVRWLAAGCCVGRGIARAAASCCRTRRGRGRRRRG